jgi:predicted GNAT family acetyltransferase
MAEASNITLSDNEANQRFEAQVEGYTAIAQYQRYRDKITFTHTEVPQELEGKGVGSALVKYALDTARKEHLTVIPLCPFVSSYIRRHQEYLDLVQADHRERLQHS